MRRIIQDARADDVELPAGSNPVSQYLLDATEFAPQLVATGQGADTGDALLAAGANTALQIPLDPEFSSVPKN